MASPGSDPLDRATRTGTGHSGSAEVAKDQAEHLSDRVKEKAGDLKRQAEESAHDLRDRARSAADEQKNATAERVGGVAHALRIASDDLRDQGQPMVAEYSRHLADGLDNMADSLSRRNIDELVEGVEDFARERPVAFLGGAVAAGFALARFMKSSATRRHQATRPSQPYYAASPAGGAMPATPTSRAPQAGTAAPGAGMAGSFSTGMRSAGVNKESGDATH